VFAVVILVVSIARLIDHKRLFADNLTDQMVANDETPNHTVQPSTSTGASTIPPYTPNSKITIPPYTPNSKIDPNSDFVELYATKNPDLADSIVKLGIVALLIDRMDQHIDIIRELLLAMMNDEIADILGEVHVEDLDNFKLFKVTIGPRRFLLRRVDNTALTEFPLLEFDSPHVVKPCLAFLKRSHNPNSGLTAWYGAEHYSESVDLSGAVKYTTAEAKAILRGMLLGLKHINSKGYCLDRITGSSIVFNRNGDLPVIAKLLGFDSFSKLGHCRVSGMSSVRAVAEAFAKRAFVPNSASGASVHFQSQDGSINFVSAADLQVVDFYLVASGYTAKPPRNIKALMNHSLITGKRFNPLNDAYGPRKYTYRPITSNRPG